MIYFRDNIYVVKTLQEFQYIDEDGKDQGAKVRQKAKDVTNLLQDESRLRDERRARGHMRDRMIRGSGDDPVGEYDNEIAQGRSASGSNPSTNGLAGKRPNRDEDELREDIEEIKNLLARDRVLAEQRDLEQSSQEEEEKRKQQQVDSNTYENYQLALGYIPDSSPSDPQTQSFHSTILPNLQVSVYCALTTFEIGISPWMHPSEWLDANTEHIRAIFDGIVDCTENKTITFPATIIFQVRSSLSSFRNQGFHLSLSG